MDRSDRPTVERPSDAALEIGRLVLELIHAAYAVSDADTGTDLLAGAGDGAQRASVSPHAIRAAIHVYQHGGRTVGELAEGLGISMGWASRVVSELEASGMVVRGSDPQDRRVVHVSLTPEAVEVVEHAYRWRADAIDRALEPLDDVERDTVREFLRRAAEAMSQANRERRGLRR
jgi:DNA-binding MarR family transcriptional regulator